MRPLTTGPSSSSITVRDRIDREWGLRASAEMAGCSVPPVALAEEAQRQLEREDRMTAQASAPAIPSPVCFPHCFPPSSLFLSCCLSRGQLEPAVQMSCGQRLTLVRLSCCLSRCCWTLRCFQTQWLLPRWTWESLRTWLPIASMIGKLLQFCRSRKDQQVKARCPPIQPACALHAPCAAHT